MDLNAYAAYLSNPDLQAAQLLGQYGGLGLNAWSGAAGAGVGAGSSTVCYTCNQPGHIAAVCPMKGAAGGAPPGGRGTGACFSCGQPGHKAYECPTKPASSGPRGAGGRGPPKRPANPGPHGDLCIHFQRRQGCQNPQCPWVHQKLEDRTGKPDCVFRLIKGICTRPACRYCSILPPSSGAEPGAPAAGPDMKPEPTVAAE